MKLFTLAFLLATVLQSCLSWAWRGYKKPRNGDIQSVSPLSNCMSIGMQNLNQEQTKAITEAVRDVCTILASEEFEDSVRARKWLVSCDQTNGQPDEMTGQQVFDLINKKIPDYSVHPRHPWRAIAQTDRGKWRVAIKPKRIKNWHATNKAIRANLVNTIAHETMHIITNDFRDAGHGTAKCPDAILVSYGIGKLVEQLWLKTH